MPDKHHSDFCRQVLKTPPFLTIPMATPTPVDADGLFQVTYHWTSSLKQTGAERSSLSVSCPKEPRRRTKSWTADTDGDDIGKVERANSRRPNTTRARPNAVSPTRVRFLYEDEEAKARVCGNAQRLLNIVQKDPEAVSTSAQLARKVLKYRRLMGRLDDVNVEDPDFDASAFFGIEWRRIGDSKPVSS
ncbi:hypothetical protein PHYBOEH_002018 [Phytophthora boehmeriae]|uniref:Uncharacterized protein n=1 Tax=Phytophthora boehmeriae TaxID=109152 RepID=A0A8T1WWI9_9STRA|nr:hypothetical protein PHYBOEH_002018 [Phytophthora boehmeriae]